MNSLSKLLSSTGSPLSDHEPKNLGNLQELAGTLADQLLAMLVIRNGFYALESALHVFPLGSSEQELDIYQWNECGLWRSAYEGLADSCLFFAEDVFGGQFCIKDSKIYTFDPETAVLEYLADDFESWAEALLVDYEVLTGCPLAHQWQKQNGEISAGTRLLPKVPFVLGGEFKVDNLYLANSVDGMRSRANIAVQIKSMPDGAEIRFSIDV